MFARGPYVNSRKLSTIFDNAVTPVEPLLFLYPRWFTFMVRQQTTVSRLRATEFAAKFHSRDKERYASRRRFNPPPSVTNVSSRALSSAERKAAAPVIACPSSPVLKAPESDFDTKEPKNDTGNVDIGSTEHRETRPTFGGRLPVQAFPQQLVPGAH
jgi:hypothetical protein